MQRNFELDDSKQNDITADIRSSGINDEVEFNVLNKAQELMDVKIENRWSFLTTGMPLEKSSKPSGTIGAIVFIVYRDKDFNLDEEDEREASIDSVSNSSESSPVKAPQ
jgi:hypothetical protein